MKLENLTVEQMESFLTGSQPIVFAVASDKDERYKFVDGVLKRYGYTRLKREDKGILIRFLIKVSDYSRQQLTRMIQRYTEHGTVDQVLKLLMIFKTMWLQLISKN